jgi:hypothetical protein
MMNIQLPTHHSECQNENRKCEGEKNYKHMIINFKFKYMDVLKNSLLIYWFSLLFSSLLATTGKKCTKQQSEQFL